MGDREKRTGEKETGEKGRRRERESERKSSVEQRCSVEHEMKKKR